MTPIRVIQTGLGLWGRNWAAHVLPGAPDVEVVAWADSEARSLRLAAEATAPPAGGSYASLEEALAEVDADAVLVTVAIPAHAEVALAALRAGKHLLLEKPFTPTLAEARQVVAEAEARGLVLSIGQNYRFFPAVPVVTELVRDGSLGELHRVRIDFRRDHRTDGKVSRSPLDHSIVSQISIHHFDLLRAILGREARQVDCRAWNPPWVEDGVLGTVSAAAILELEGGVVASYGGSLRSGGPETSWPGDWHLEFQHGEIVWRREDDSSCEVVEVRPHRRPARRVTVPDAAPNADRLAVLAGFVAAVRNGVAPPSSGRDNMHSLAILTAALESVATGHPVRVSTS